MAGIPEGGHLARSAGTLLRTAGDSDLDCVDDRRGVLMFPEPENDPTGILEGLGGLCIPFLVADELRLPVLGVPDRVGAVNRAGMPEATIEVYGDPHSGEDDVGAGRKTWEWRDIHSVPEPAAMEFATYAKLERRVAATVGPHRLRRARSRCPRLGHGTDAIPVLWVRASAYYATASARESGSWMSYTASSVSESLARSATKAWPTCAATSTATALPITPMTRLRGPGNS